MSLRNTSSKILSVLSGLLGVVNGSTTDAQSFADCGVLVQGVECVLFATDSGGEYLLDTHGAFQVGDGVFVTGDLIPGCITTCLQGDGCIHNNTIELCLGLPIFARGDTDGDGEVHPIVDAVFLLNFGFSNGSPPPCPDAADVDDDGFLKILVDALYLLHFGFLSGSPPAAPYPFCGLDPTSDDLTCVRICP